ncbi:MAG: hypothetical protein DMG76_37810 [Acidobacteria bacterium]|nr:MAG: hypothetical protein DMG76_37810 [Acidobacteriota bacterium]
MLVVRITDKGHIEHFFTTDFERRDGKTMVTINHAPKIVASVVVLLLFQTEELNRVGGVERIWV